MTRKDYELIAQALKSGYMAMPRNPMGSENNSYDQYIVIVRHLGNALLKDNPRFDKIKFYDACGASLKEV